MRLLSYDGGGDFRLADFFKSTIPEYAILSHIWEGKEIPFKDLQNGAGTKKARCKKVRFNAEQANRDGLQYVWADTLRVSLKGLFSNTDSFSKDMCRPCTALGFGNEVGVS
jgi:hypothetical protein